MQHVEHTQDKQPKEEVLRSKVKRPLVVVHTECIEQEHDYNQQSEAYNSVRAHKLIKWQLVFVWEKLFLVRTLKSEVIPL